MVNIINVARVTYKQSFNASRSTSGSLFGSLPLITSSPSQFRTVSSYGHHSPLFRLLPVVSITYTSKRNAGHSKWQNIRHTKGANDMKKGQIASHFAVAIKKEASSRGTDPKLNPYLAKLIDAAIKAGVTKDTVNRNIERAKNVKYKSFTIELLGPGGCIILCTMDAESVGKARQDVRVILKNISMATKHFTKPVMLMKEGSGIVAFETKGAIKIGKKDKNGSEISHEKAEEIAIEAEAEEVADLNNNGSSEDGVQDIGEEESWTLRTSQADLYLVKSYIEKNFPDIVILDCDTDYIPRYTVTLDDKDMEIAAIFFSELESNEEIGKVYSNINDSE